MPTEYKLPEYTAYFDTNAAVSKEPGNQISTQLLKGIERSRSLTAVDVRAPAVVIEELIYQKFKVAKAAASNLRKNSRTLADICKSPNMEPPSDEELEAGIRNQFEECLRRSAITVISTPLKHIDWESVVADSCWRRPPFEKPKSEDDHAEKGFRDKIILETSIIDLRSVKSGVIAFISNDNMLRTTYQERAKCDLPIEVYCGFDEFIGFIREVPVWGIGGKFHG